MKTKECISKGIKIAELSIRKVTSYDMVKGRLSRGLYSDEYLQNRLKYEDQIRKLVDSK